jgi:uncharacterized protein YraI
MALHDLPLAPPRCRPVFFMGVLLSLLLTGCGLFGGDEQPAPVAEPTVLPITPLPTFTATPIVLAPGAQGTAIVSPTAAMQAAAVLTPTVVVTVPPALTVTAAVTTPATLTPTAASPVAAAAAELVITGDAVNIRSGPDTSFEIVGAATKDQVFPIIGKNAGGDWWQICCFNNQPGWVFGELAQVRNGETVAVITDLPAPAAPVAEIPPTATPATIADAPTSTPAAQAAEPTPAPTTAPVAAVNPIGEGSAGNFDPNAQYQIVHFKVRGLDENNGGIRDSASQHHIFVTVLDANGNGVDGAVVRNAVGEKQDVVTGDKGPGKAEITMYWEPFKLYVASDPSGPVTSQVSNQMGLAFPHLPDIVGKLGGVDYEYGVCPTLEIKCQWPITAVHFSYEITFQKVK